MRKALLALWVMCILFISGCGLVDSQLKHDPGQDSKLEQEVKAIAPVAGPWGTLAIALATIATGVYGAFHAREANKQTDKPTA